MINIFEYTDFRSYLNDYFRENKAKYSFFSHRYLCQKLGLKSSNYILLVMKGKRNISSEICFKLSTLCKHSQREAAYFINMVYFSQAKNYKEKDSYWEKMTELRQKTKFGQIHQYQYEYYNNWYNIAVRELIPEMDRPIDYGVLSRLITPPITIAQARKSVQLLLQLEMIQETETGYTLRDPIVKTNDMINSLAVFNYHLKMSTIATQALENYRKEERNFSSCTMNLSPHGYNKVVENINDFRDKLMTICKQDTGSERIYHINFQLFPVSIKHNEEKGK